MDKRLRGGNLSGLSDIAYVLTAERTERYVIIDIWAELLARCGRVQGIKWTAMSAQPSLQGYAAPGAKTTIPESKRTCIRYILQASLEDTGTRKVSVLRMAQSIVRG
jgi:hypothetical protein